VPELGGPGLLDRSSVELGNHREPRKGARGRRHHQARLLGHDIDQEMQEERGGGIPVRVMLDDVIMGSRTL
jgi:hypothetical protein